MRPEILFNLFASVSKLPGVGPRTLEAIKRICGSERIIDVLWHMPENIIDRRHSPVISEAKPGHTVTMAVTVEKHVNPPNKRAPYRVFCSDDTGNIPLVFFRAREDYLKRILPVGEQRIISGQVEAYDNSLQMSHPDFIVPLEERDTVEIVEPVYGLTAGLSNKVFTKAITGALAHVPELPEWADDAHLAQNGWSTWKDSLLSLHKPQALNDLTPDTKVRARLAYDELLANQLAIALVRQTTRKRKGQIIEGDGSLTGQIINSLPFELTASQKNTVDEIRQDMGQSDRMLRLLQGDVGSGKTVVALISMLNAVEAGFQAALMVPTEILARQHLDTLFSLCKDIPVKIALLTGREKGKARTAILEQLVSGGINIIIGTHALFQEQIEYKNLGLAIIDEQHRFGVHQRLLLAEKGHAVDVLVMTATPIPRTLTLTTYGDMDVSKLTEKPVGRKPVLTRAVPSSRLNDVVDGLKRSIQQNKRIYWICPLVEESEKIDATAAEERASFLQNTLGADKVGLVHGRMKGDDKDAVMARFSSGQINVLVGTTIIEVGVDVPEATIMVIEQAERFGLSQLHQLRGRIGRGAEESSCLLVYGGNISQMAKDRIEIMRRSEDGFEIAEKDLELRGAGEVLGTRQSGLPVFRIADLAHHADLLATARRDAQLILQRDPDLNTDRGRALRVLLYLFERDSAIKNLRSG